MTSCDDAAMELERHWPEDVLQSIFRRLLFPEVLKVGMISHRWRELFKGFIYKKWSQYSPVLFRYPASNPDRLQPSRSGSSKSASPNLLAYNKSEFSWEFLPLRQTVSERHFQISLVRVLGPILVQVYFPVFEKGFHSGSGGVIKSSDRVAVSNIFTGESVLLPALDKLDLTLVVSNHEAKQLRYIVKRDYVFRDDMVSLELLDVGILFDSQGYRVILIYRMIHFWDHAIGIGIEGEDGELERLVLFEYRSGSGIWKEKFTVADIDSCHIVTQSMVLKDNKLFTIGIDPARIWRYSLDDVVMETANESEEPEFVILSKGSNIQQSWTCDFAGLVVVGKKLMAITVEDLEVACVYEVDEETLDLTEISWDRIGELNPWKCVFNEFVSRTRTRIPSLGECWAWKYRVTAGPESIFVWPCDEMGSDVLDFDVAKQTWNKFAVDVNQLKWTAILAGGSAMELENLDCLIM